MSNHVGKGRQHLRILDRPDDIAMRICRDRRTVDLLNDVSETRKPQSPCGEFGWTEAQNLRQAQVDRNGGWLVDLNDFATCKEVRVRPF